MKLVLESLSSFLAQEAALAGGLGYELCEIKMELESINSFLVDADQRKDNNEVVRPWVNQVRDVAFDIEDIIDEFMYRKDRHRRGGIFKGFLYYPMEIMARHGFGNQIQQIKTRVQAISDRRNRYGLELIEKGTQSYNLGDRWLNQGETSLFEEDGDVVGLKEKLDLLVGWLAEEEPQRVVVSVVGMGGVGKTTLVATALEAQTVKKHFDCHAWASVSQSYRIDELLRGIVKEMFEAAKEEIPSDLRTMNARELTQMLHKYLEKKRYVIVLDDIWSIDAMNDIKIAFPKNSCGSRIVLTTRNEDVALASSEKRRFYLQPLNETEAWNLFCKKAFWKEPGRRCPPSLHPLAQDIVRRCEGLPLAIVALSGLLSLKDTNVVEWDIVNNSLRWELSNNEMLKRMKSILLLSFNDLPYYLKHCFLYCSIFPEDYLIKRKRLIRLWIAEGFIGERGRLTMEEVAEVYLKELLCRNMLQVAKTNHFGRVKLIRMHDLVRELALSICREEKFFMDFDGQEATSIVHTRRLAIYKGDASVPLNSCASRLRSLFTFMKDVPPSISFHSNKSCFRLLRVLDLEGAPIVNVPNELVELFNLSYLNLKGTKVKELPKSIGSLRNLQTLNVSDTNIEKLPKTIVQLQKLRHLLTYCVNTQSTRGYKSYNLYNCVGVPKGICCLKSLQSLCCIQAKGDIVKQVRNLTQLRMFAILRVRAIDGPDLCASVSNMKRLLTLGVVAINENEPLRLEALSSPPPHLQKLLLCGHLEKVPNWFSFLTNLAYLYLFWSQLQEETLSSLQALPKLVLLQLAKAYDGKELCFHAGRFPVLRKLRLCDMAHLKSLMIEDGALPCIQKLSLIRCGELKLVPGGIEYLGGLQELYLEEMPEEFIEKLREDKCKDHLRVKHIPIIEHSYRREMKWITERLS